MKGILEIITLNEVKLVSLPENEELALQEKYIHIFKTTY